MTHHRVPFTGLNRQQYLTEELLTATEEVLRHGVWVDGPYREQLELWLQEYTNRTYAILCHSGTQALEIVSEYLRAECSKIFSNDRPMVLMPNLSFPATASSWQRNDWLLHFGDTDRWGVLSDSVRASYFNSNNQLWGSFEVLVGIWGTTRHCHRLYKNPFTTTVEDASQNWVAGICDWAIASTISFDPTKNLPATGNGGAILTDDERLARYCLSVVRHGGRSYEIAGTNSRMSEQDCSHVLVRSRYLQQWQQRRAKIARYWWSELNSLPLTMITADPGSSDGCTRTVINSNQKCVIYTESRDSLVSWLTEHGVDTKIHYSKTLHELAAFDSSIHDASILSAAVMLTRGVFSLPMYPELTDTEVEYVADTIKRFYK